MAYFDVKDKDGLPQMLVGGVDVVNLHDEIEDRPLPGESVGDIAVVPEATAEETKQIPITRIANVGGMALVGRIAEMKLNGELDAQAPCPEIIQEIIDYSKSASEPGGWLTAY